MDLDELNKEIRNCTKCSLHKTRSKAVPNEGSEDADILFMGKKVGRKDDKIGQPYKGETGKVLDDILDDLGFDRNDVFLTNLTRCYGGSRDPKKRELDKCASYFEKELKIIDPNYIVALGKLVAERLLQKKIKLKEVHGSIYTYTTLTYSGKLLLTYNIGSILRDTSKYDTILRDIEKIL